MTVTYDLVEEIYSTGASQRVSYGIVACADASECGSATIVASVHDVTSDKQKLADFILLCNRSNLSVIHFEDVVKDFVGVQ